METRELKSGFYKKKLMKLGNNSVKLCFRLIFVQKSHARFPAGNRAPQTRKVVRLISEEIEFFISLQLILLGLQTGHTRCKYF